MAFENVNVASLKSNLEACKNYINNSISEELPANIMNADIWYSDARGTLKNALDRLNSLYDALENRINHYLSVANQIEQYQNLVSENQKLESEYSNLESKLWYQEKYTITNYNSETETYEYEEATRTVKDTNVENKMYSVRNEINSNNTTMESLKNSINSSI